MNAPMLANRGEHMKLTGIVRKVDELGRTILYISASRGFYELTKLLIISGAVK